MLQGSCSPRTTLTGEANGEAAQPTAKAKNTGLGLTGGAKGSSGAVRQDGRNSEVNGCGEAAVTPASGPFHGPSGDPAVRQCTSGHPDPADYRAWLWRQCRLPF